MTYLKCIAIVNCFYQLYNLITLCYSADVIFDPNRTIKFRTKSDSSVFGCVDKNHHQIPLVGIFNREGLSGTAVNPTGALCQLQ